MNNFSSLARILLLILLGNLNVWADLVTFPAGDAHWTVTLTPKQSEAPASPLPPGIKPLRQPQKIDVTQVNNVRRLRMNWSDGTSTEQWAIPGLPVVFKQVPETGQVYEMATGDTEAKIDRFDTPCDASAFSWMHAGNLVEKTPIDYQGTPCFHYRGSRSALATRDSVKCEAWIDSTTLLPVAFDSGTALVTFVFDPKPPQGPLDPPAAFAKEIKHYKAIMGFR